MKKLGVLLLVFLISVSCLAIVSCQNRTMDERAYSCLESNVRGKCASLTFDEKVFALLALSSKSDIASECQAALSGECAPVGGAPVGGCTIKSTAQAVLALTQSGAPADNKITWLLQKSTAPSLVWYLQIDTPANTTCQVGYPGTELNVLVKSDGTLSIPNNNCLRARAPYNYWLEIDKSCLGNTFTIRCNQDFSSSTIYKTQSSSTIFVSGSVQPSPATGTNTHEIKSKCLSETGTCDYQGTLWAAYALMKSQREEYKQYLPYLFAFADDNKKYVSYAFLYAFTAEPEYEQKLLIEQKPEGYWDWASGKGKFYDTATTLLALQSKSTVVGTVQSYLALKQGKDGCWQSSIIDTGFLMWALYPKPSSFQTTQPKCQDSQYFCVVEGECIAAAGDKLQNYYCPGAQVCCSKPAVLQSCDALGGVTCPPGKECQNPADSSDGPCCMTTCGAVTTECESIRYSCRGFCEDNEEVTEAYACSGKDMCCKPAAQKASVWVWIILFLILIGLGALGYVYRERVKHWYYKARELIRQKLGKKGPGPAPAMTRPRPPYPPMYPPARPLTHPRTAVSSDIEETLKKLRDIGK